MVNGRNALTIWRQNVHVRGNRQLQNVDYDVNPQKWAVRHLKLNLCTIIIEYPLILPVSSQRECSCRLPRTCTRWRHVVSVKDTEP